MIFSHLFFLFYTFFPFLGLLCPIGIWGELWVGGCGVARGYVGVDNNNNNFTKGFGWVEGEWLGEVVPKGVFLEREKEEGNNNNNNNNTKYKMKFYRTGDIVRWLPDGRLEFLSRSSADRQIKLRGHRFAFIDINNIEIILIYHLIYI